MVTSVQSHDLFTCYPTMKQHLWVAHKNGLISVVLPCECAFCMLIMHEFNHSQLALCDIVCHHQQNIACRCQRQHILLHVCAKSWVNTFTHACHTVVCTQNINVSPNKNVCNPEGAQENGSLCTLPCTNMKCTHRAWCTTACMVAWNRLCMHACINAHICMSHDEYDHRGINTILNARWASFTIVCHLAQVVAFNITLC